MNVLAFDTCLGALSAALCGQDGQGQPFEHEAFETREGGHAERLMPMIEGVMDAAGLAFADLDRIAVTVGPGTFTGVRVAVAAARGLALASGLPVVGASSLAVMAHRAEELLGAPRADRLLVVAVDARRGMLYAQIFPGTSAEHSEPLLLRPEEIAALVGMRRAVVVGSGADAAAARIVAAGGTAEARLTDLQPHARSLALLAADLAPATSLRPLYLRPPDVRPQADKSLPRATL
jgi:tRNA threonylcarbamoyl adenosine modification protein YeaZ